MSKNRWITIVLAVALLATGALAMRYRADYQTANRRLRHATENQAVVTQFFSLPQVAPPSVISPFWTARASGRFEDAPIRIVEYADPLCVDCQVMYHQMEQLKIEFKGMMNVAYQFFPLEAKCNDVVEKDKHPGACELSYMLASDSSKFLQMHNELYDSMTQAKSAEWRAAFATRHGVERALTDSSIQVFVHQIIRTGTEYDKTSDKFAHGIRSTPTMIVNGRMIIGTLPISQMRAIFNALIEASKVRNGKFLENWLDPGCAVDSDVATGQCSAS